MRFFSTLSILFALSSCANVKLKDSTWFGSMQQDGAAEFHTNTTENHHISRDEFLRRWDDPSHPMIATYVETFADWKAVREKLCSYSPGHCTYEDMQKLSAAMHKITHYWLYTPALEARLNEFPIE